MALTYDLEFQYQVKRSAYSKRYSGHKQTDKRTDGRTDTIDCFAFPANVVRNH